MTASDDITPLTLTTRATSKKLAIVKTEADRLRDVIATGERRQVERRQQLETLTDFIAARDRTLAQQRARLAALESPSPLAAVRDEILDDDGNLLPHGRCDECGQPDPCADHNPETEN